MFHFGHSLQTITICFLKIINMGQRQSILFAPFPADILVWEILLRILLFPSKGAKRHEEKSFCAPVGFVQRYSREGKAPAVWKGVPLSQMLTIKFD